MKAIIKSWVKGRKYWREYGWIEILVDDEGNEVTMIGNDPNPDPTPAEWLADDEELDVEDPRTNFLPSFEKKVTTPVWDIKEELD